MKIAEAWIECGGGKRTPLGIAGVTLSATTGTIEVGNKRWSLKDVMHREKGIISFDMKGEPVDYYANTPLIRIRIERDVSDLFKD